jgi:hypothetical protein
MSSRKVHQAPTFTRLDRPEDIRRTVLEIQKLKPYFEVSIESHDGMARGRIQHWDPAKKLLTVRWTKADEAFHSACGMRTGLRSFFKVRLLSTQLVFRSELIRRLPDGQYQYRIPLELFQSQLRKSLRIPLGPGQAKLASSRGIFPILDLSASGARIAIPIKISSRLHQLDSCFLVLGRHRISTSGFEVTLTHRDEESAGCRFRGLDEAIRIEIKQFLIEALHLLFKGAPS